MVGKFNRVALLLSAGLALSAASASAQTESTFDKIKRTGVFTAGLRANFPPIGSVDDKGNPIGFGPELSKIFADKMGVQVKYSGTRSDIPQHGA